jgi:hypothetical protein
MVVPLGQSECDGETTAHICRESFYLYGTTFCYWHTRHNLHSEKTDACVTVTERYQVFNSVNINRFCYK